MFNVREIYKYREFLKTSIKKDFRGKYKKSFLGLIWSFLNPLCQLLVYAFVFPLILKNNIENYPMFLIIAIMPWNFLNSTVTQSTLSIINNGGIIKKVYFPREILPISTVTSGLINFLITELIVIISLLISGVGIGVSILFLPIVIIIQYIFQIGISFILSSITVYIRDLEHFIQIIMMLLFYMTPIVYSADMIPDKFLIIFKLNPMFHIINYYREILYFKQVPNMQSILILFIFCVIILVLGVSLFRKLEKRFAEEL